MNTAQTRIHIPQLDDDTAAVRSQASFVPLRLRGESNSEIVEVNEFSVIVGRHSAVDVRLPAPDISRQHCRLYFDNGTWKVQDLSSLNGVYVNDEPVRSAPIYLGDQLRMGTTTFVVECATPRRGQRKKMETLRSIAKAMED